MPDRPRRRAPVAAARRLTHDETGAVERVASNAPTETLVTVDPRRPARAARRRPRRRWLRWTLAVLGAMILTPFVAFVIGWIVFPVPTADDAATTQVSTFTFADGTTPLAVVRPENVNRVKVPLDKVPPVVRNAVLSAEDATFYSNPGFDLTGILRALFNQATGGVGGGSTITQQYIKVSTGQDDVSLWRKYREIVLAVKISRVYTKDQILENYLNTIYFGRGAYGIQAAAQAYFGKDIGQLSASEGALLAGVIQSPSRWDPAKSEPDAQRRWTYVLDQMVAHRFLDPGERARAVFPAWTPPRPEPGGVPDDDRYHVFERAKAELAAMGITDQQIATEGLTVTTTIDEQDQRRAVDAVSTVSRGQPGNLRYALVSIDPRTGAVLAYDGGAQGLGVDYAGAALRQPGSSYKPFVFSAALQAGLGIGLGTRYDGSSPQTIKGQTVGNSEGADCADCTVATAMTRSINTVFYRMADQIGVRAVIDAAHQAGIPADLATVPRLGIALGDQEVHPIDMASAYATFAADGVRHVPHLVTKVQAADGRVLFAAADGAGATQAVDPQVARNVTESMLQVATSSGVALAGDRPVASKSGTAQNEQIKGQNRDAWYVGYTPQISTAVWVGSDRSDAIKNSAGRPIYGRMLPGSIWQMFMNAALRGQDVEQFAPLVALGDQVPVDNSGNGGGTGDGSGGTAPTGAADSTGGNGN